jgi:hypothetical protein
LLRNHNSAIPQSQFFLKSTTWEFHFRNFRHIFGRGVTGNINFLPPSVFCYSEDFKGTVARDCRPPFISWTIPIWK